MLTNKLKSLSITAFEKVRPFLAKLFPKLRKREIYGNHFENRASDKSVSRHRLRSLLPPTVFDPKDLN